MSADRRPICYNSLCQIPVGDSLEGFGLFHLRRLRKISQAHRARGADARGHGEHVFRCSPSTRSSIVSERQPLPERYLGLSDAELDARIAAAQAPRSAPSCVILGHHYQRDEVIKFADYTGDSLRLAQQCASHPEADYIIFCGVHFMAESADMLSAPHQQVILPDLAAGCSMADMAAIDQLERAGQSCDRRVGVTDVVPVTYINSSAAIKGVRRRARRHRLHVVERRRDPAMGVGARASRSCFCPISIWAATLPTRWACRSTRWLVWDPDEAWGGLSPSRSQAARS